MSLIVPCQLFVAFYTFFFFPLHVCLIRMFYSLSTCWHMIKKVVTYYGMFMLKNKLWTMDLEVLDLTMLLFCFEEFEVKCYVKILKLGNLPKTPTFLSHGFHMFDLL